MTGTEPPPMSGATQGGPMTPERLRGLREFWGYPRPGESLGGKSLTVLECIEEIERCWADLAGLRAALADKPGAGLVVGEYYDVSRLPLGTEVQSSNGPLETWHVTEKERAFRPDQCVRKLVSLQPQSAPADTQPTQMTEEQRKQIADLVVECLCLTPGRDGLLLDWVDPKQSAQKSRKIDAALWDDISAAIKGGG